MATTVTYKGQVLVTVDNSTKVLETSGTWCEDDFTLTDVSGGGSSGMKLSTGTNLIDTSQFIANKYLESGVEATYNGWSITNYIPVTADKWYFIYSGSVNEGFSPQYSAYYDTNKDYIENFLPAGSDQPKFLTISLAQKGMVNLMKSKHTGYLRLSQKTATVIGFGFYELDGDLDLSPIV